MTLVTTIIRYVRITPYERYPNTIYSVSPSYIYYCIPHVVYLRSVAASNVNDEEDDVVKNVFYVC